MEVFIITIFFIFISLLILSFIIFVHELFHFLAAKWLGIHSTEFAIGFGPSFFSAKKVEQKIKMKWFPKKNDFPLDDHSTVYHLKWIPLGGFVSFGREVDGVMNDGLSKHKPWKRIIVAFAGPLGNFLLALVALLFFLNFHAQTSTITHVQTGSPAEELGFNHPDILLVDVNEKNVSDPSLSKINNLLIKDSENCFFLINGNKSGEMCQFLTSEEVENFGLSIESNADKFTWSFGENNLFYKSISSFKFLITSYITGIWEVITNVQIDQFSGPVGIVNLMQENLLDLYFFCFLFIVINIALGVANLLFPFSITDGGRIVIDFMAILLRKNQINTKYLDFLSVLILIGFMLFVTYLDITRLF